MKKIIWKIRYAMYMNRRLGLWRFNSCGFENAESAIDNDPDCLNWSHEEAADEDLSYWTD